PVACSPAYVGRIDRGRDRSELRGGGTARPLPAQGRRDGRTSTGPLSRPDLVYQRGRLRLVVLGGRSRRSAHAHRVQARRTGLPLSPDGSFGAIARALASGVLGLPV